jgi:hypothetical protein
MAPNGFIDFKHFIESSAGREFSDSDIKDALKNRNVVRDGKKLLVGGEQIVDPRGLAMVIARDLNEMNLPPIENPLTVPPADFVDPSERAYGNDLRIPELDVTQLNENYIPTGGVVTPKGAAPIKTNLYAEVIPGAEILVNDPAQFPASTPIHEVEMTGVFVRPEKEEEEELPIDLEDVAAELFATSAPDHTGNFSLPTFSEPSTTFQDQNDFDLLVEGTEASYELKSKGDVEEMLIDALADDRFEMWHHELSKLVELHQSRDYIFAREGASAILQAAYRDQDVEDLELLITIRDEFAILDRDYTADTLQDDTEEIKDLKELFGYLTNDPSLEKINPSLINAQGALDKGDYVVAKGIMTRLLVSSTELQMHGENRDLARAIRDSLGSLLGEVDYSDNLPHREDDDEQEFEDPFSEKSVEELINVGLDHELGFRTHHGVLNDTYRALRAGLPVDALNVIETYLTHQGDSKLNDNGLLDRIRMGLQATVDSIVPEFDYNTFKENLFEETRGHFESLGVEYDFDTFDRALILMGYFGGNSEDVPLKRSKRGEDGTIKASKEEAAKGLSGLLENIARISNSINEVIGTAASGVSWKKVFSYLYDHANHVFDVDEEAFCHEGGDVMDARVLSSNVAYAHLGQLGQLDLMPYYELAVTLDADVESIEPVLNATEIGDYLYDMAVVVRDLRGETSFYGNAPEELGAILNDPEKLHAALLDMRNDTTRRNRVKELTKEVFDLEELPIYTSPVVSRVEAAAGPLLGHFKDGSFYITPLVEEGEYHVPGIPEEITDQQLTENLRAYFTNSDGAVKSVLRELGLERIFGDVSESVNREVFANLTTSVDEVFGNLSHYRRSNDET